MQEVFFLLFSFFLDFLSQSPLEENSTFQDSEQSAEWLQQERSVFCSERLCYSCCF